MPNALFIEPVNDVNINEIVPLDRVCNPDPWTPQMFNAFVLRGNGVGFLARDRNTGRVIGYILGSLSTTAATVVNLGVDPGVRRRKVGTILIEYAKTQWLTGYRRSLMLNVPDTNLDAHLFLRELGFEAVGVLAGLYGPDQDGYRFMSVKPKPRAIDKFLRRAG